MATHLLLKILLVPSFIFGITRGARRFGPAIGGWLTGLPVVAGPVMFFIALEQGAAFASKASLATLAGLIALAAYCLVYARVSRRAGVTASLVSGWSAFVLSAVLLERIPFTLSTAFPAAIASFVLAYRLLPDTPPPGAGKATPHWEIHLRMAAAVLLVFVLTGLADAVGPRWSGLFTPFPVAATVVTAFTHRYQGRDAVARLLRGFIGGLGTLAVFFLVLSWALPARGVGVSFAAAVAAALLAHGAALFLVRRIG